MLRVVINGQPREFQSGTSILTGLQTIGVRVPTLCHDDRLAPTGACRSCLISVKGWGRLVPACATPLADGMVIETETPELEEHRRSLLRLLAWRYPPEAAAQFPEKEFHRALREYGLEGFATFHTKEVFLNAVTGPNRDTVTGTPEYKVTAVRIERL